MRPGGVGVEILLDEAWWVMWRLCPMGPGWHWCGGSAG